MIVAVLLVGLLLTSTALRGTEHELAQQLQQDMIGKDGFIIWAGSLLAIGMIGYIPGLRNTSRYLLALILVVIVLRNGGLFTEATLSLEAASVAGPAPPISPPMTGPSPGATQVQQSGSTSSGGSTAGNVIGGIAKALPALALL